MAVAAPVVPDAADPQYTVALNLISRSPAWLSALGARPMYLGLDLRGGVHFMLQVDMQAALTKRAESLAGDLRTVLRDKGIRHGGVAPGGVATGDDDVGPSGGEREGDGAADAAGRAGDEGGTSVELGGHGWFLP